MASSKENVDILSHLFKTKYKKNKKVIYVIVEGDDDIVYYSQFLEKYMIDGWYYEIIKAPKNGTKQSSKKQIIRFFNNLDWRSFNKKQIVIFIDKDLSKFVNEKIPDCVNIYTTDGYSIENSIINKRIFCRTICELCYFTNINVEQQQYLETLFTEIIEEFYFYMIDIMVWFIHWVSANNKIQADKIKMKDLFKIEKAKLIKKEENFVQYIHNQTQIPFDSEAPIANIKEIFEKELNFQKFVRGKYLWQIFIIICHYVIQNNNEIPQLKLTKRCKSNPKLDFIDIAHLAVCPDSLRLFLDKTVKEYIMSNI